MPIPSNFKIDTSKPVMVTGATGYVAGELIKQLVEAGVTVHAAVRDPFTNAKIRHLMDLGDQVKFFQADLLEEGSYAESMAGCSHVFHTASPFTSKIEDPQRDMVDPALKGTENVLKTAGETDSVQRVILTSSCVAIYGDAIDIQDYEGGTMTEANWNTTSTLTHQTYSYSKTLAEQRAWELAQAQDRYDLVVINPGFILGPGLADNPTSESFSIIGQLVDGTMKMGAPAFDIGCVDVRDVALAHIRAAYTPQAEGRHITVTQRMSFLAIAQAIGAEIEGLPLPTREMPKWLLWLVGPLADKSITRKLVSRNVGYPWKFNNTKARTALGMDFRPVAPAIVAMARQVLDKPKD